MSDGLMTLKGIGEARAAAIIKGSPHARKDELVQQKILPESVYNEFKDMIGAKQQSKPSATTLCSHGEDISQLSERRRPR
jgi:hypothetical protein